MRKDFVCPSCGHLWSMESDKDGLFNGYGNPPCPICGVNGRSPKDFKDYTCNYCGHHWRVYGNGGLILGRVPRCPKCGN